MLTMQEPRTDKELQWERPEWNGELSESSEGIYRPSLMLLMYIFLWIRTVVSLERGKQTTNSLWREIRTTPPISAINWNAPSIWIRRNCGLDTILKRLQRWQVRRNRWLTKRTAMKMGNFEWNLSRDSRTTRKYRWKPVQVTENII